MLLQRCFFCVNHRGACPSDAAALAATYVAKAGVCVRACLVAVGRRDRLRIFRECGPVWSRQGGHIDIPGADYRLLRVGGPV